MTEQSSWYGSVRVLRDGRLRFSPRTFLGLHHVSVFHSSMHVAVLSGGREVLYLYPEQNRVLSACFVYTLQPEQLREAIRELRTVSGGLAGWLVPALEWTQADLAGVKDPGQARPDLLEIIPGLLEDCRMLPVAEVWKRKRRELQQRWAARLQEHPEEIVEITAPWMLPAGHTSAARMLQGGIQALKKKQRKPRRRR
ncbi:MAG TPA: hypothetical protein VK447_03120 [Myxococcaceae bacterium]|nr:hypothetical protein [Myxococcaceae bacterium]